MTHFNAVLLYSISMWGQVGCSTVLCTRSSLVHAPTTTASFHLVRFQYDSSHTCHIMSQSESPVNLLQDCVVGAGSASDATDIKCHQKYEKGDGSPMNILIDVLSNKAASIKSFVSSDGSSAKSAHSTLIHDFNMSTRVWGDSSQR